MRSPPGVPIASAVWDDVATWLGTALSSVVWALNPDAIVIGGGIARAGSVLFDPLEKRMQSMLSPVFSDDLQILPARFGNDAGAVVAAGRPQVIEVARLEDVDVQFHVEASGQSKQEK